MDFGQLVWASNVSQDATINQINGVKKTYLFKRGGYHYCISSDNNSVDPKDICGSIEAWRFVYPAQTGKLHREMIENIAHRVEDKLSGFGDLMEPMMSEGDLKLYGDLEEEFALFHKWARRGFYE